MCQVHVVYPPHGYGQSISWLVYSRLKSCDDDDSGRFLSRVDAKSTHVPRNDPSADCSSGRGEWVPIGPRGGPAWSITDGSQFRQNCSRGPSEIRARRDGWLPRCGCGGFASVWMSRLFKEGALCSGTTSRRETARTGCLPDMENLQSILHLLREVLDVLAVLCWQQYRLHARSESTDKFLLDATDRRDLSSEGYLALSWMSVYGCWFHAAWIHSKHTVMAIVGGTGFPEKREISAMAWPIPLLGPSLGMAPEGQWT